ncbi:PilZ domain-containing protein [Parahaliea aestuarii]|uniref:PilZ domain-containing protein n=1 Tax=Parahaliea aestuarii TaxID=1852021 RepID=A0A5C8ZQ39_9GAMM|nr:PilZ domain-containing protein [Parahaliea aestuarii]TXS90548.1 PilZ domain-containing protein [Parahaliea aestuarii]
MIERRQCTRIKIDLPVEVQQGGSVWKQRLIDISLSGVATDQPDVWDAQYNEPFTLLIQLDDGDELELHAYLQHVESGRLGFSVQHVDRENIEPLRRLLEDHVDDPAVIAEEIKRLG